MTIFIIRRVMQAIFLLLVMSIIIFVGIFAIGDPIEMLVPENASFSDVEAARRNLGLDKPLWVQYGVFLKNVLKGNIGNSFVYARPALELIWQRLPASIELTIVAMIISIALGIPLGLFAGLFPNMFLSRLIMAGSIFGFSVPGFWVGMVLIMLFAVMLGWVPATGRGELVVIFGTPLSIFTWDGLKHIILPAATLSMLPLSLYIRLARAGLREILLLDYIKFARAKGLSNLRVIGMHAMKNIMIPIVTVIGLEIGTLLAGSISVEMVFAWPGMGWMVIQAINQLDRPIVVAFMLTTLSIFIVLNCIVDILYTILDPRIQLVDIED